VSQSIDADGQRFEARPVVAQAIDGGPQSGQDRDQLGQHLSQLDGLLV
jgi:hypothetical protein